MPNQPSSRWSVSIASVAAGRAAFAVVLAVAAPGFAQSRGSLGSAGVGRLGIGYPSLSIGSVGYNRFINYSIGADLFLDQRRPAFIGSLRSDMTRNRRAPLGAWSGHTRRTTGRGPNRYGPDRPGAGRVDRPPLGRTPRGSVAGPSAGLPTFHMRSETRRRRATYSTGNPARGFGYRGRTVAPAASGMSPYGAGEDLFAAPHPEAVAGTGRSSWMPTQPVRSTPSAGGEALREPPKTAVSISDYLTVQRQGRHDVYVRRAWEHFHNADYPRALATFRLAETVAMTGSEAGRGVLYAAIVCEQYMLAASRLGRLLRDDPNVFVHQDHLRTRFPSPEAYRETLNRMRDGADRVDAAVPARALYAFLLWQDADRQSVDHAHALGLARAIAEADPQGPYSAMADRMADGDAAMATHAADSH